MLERERERERDREREDRCSIWGREISDEEEAVVCLLSVGLEDWSKGRYRAKRLRQFFTVVFWFCCPISLHPK